MLIYLIYVSFVFANPFIIIKRYMHSWVWDGVADALIAGWSIFFSIFQVSEITTHPRGSEKHADKVLEKTKAILQVLSSKNIFRPKVLAKVKHNDKWCIGSSIAVSHFLRPLCLYSRIINFKYPLQKAIVYYAPLDTPDKENWSSLAFSGTNYDTKKPPCDNCSLIFKNLSGFISSSDSSAERGNSTFLGACAEYCPVNQLVEDKVEPALSLQRDKQLKPELEKLKKQCLVLFEDFPEIIRECESEDIRDAYKKIRHKVLIFGLKPECNNQLSASP